MKEGWGRVRGRDLRRRGVSRGTEKPRVGWGSRAGNHTSGHDLCAATGSEGWAEHELGDLELNVV